MKKLLSLFIVFSLFGNAAHAIVAASAIEVGAMSDLLQEAGPAYTTKGSTLEHTDIVRFGDARELKNWYREHNTKVSNFINSYYTTVVEKLRTVILDSNKRISDIENVITEVTNSPKYTPKEGRTNAKCREKLALIIGHLLNQRRIKQKQAKEAGRITKEEIFELQQDYHKKYIIEYLGTVYSELEKEFKDILNKSDSYKLQRWVVRKSRAIEDYLKNYSDEKPVHENALKLLEKSTVTSFTNRNNVLSTLVGICSKSHTYYVRSVQHKNTGYYAAGGDMFKQSKRRLPLAIAAAYFMTKKQLMQATEEHKREQAARKRNQNTQRTRRNNTAARHRERNERRRPRLVNKHEEQRVLDHVRIYNVVKRFVKNYVENEATRTADKKRKKEKESVFGKVTTATMFTLAVAAILTSTMVYNMFFGKKNTDNKDKPDDK